jgi:hypothetical protein
MALRFIGQRSREMKERDDFRSTMRGLERPSLNTLLLVLLALLTPRPRAKLKDYPHLMMELFEAAAGN